MNYWQKFKFRPHNKIILVFLTFLFVIFSNKIVISKTAIPVAQSQYLKLNNSETYQISQNFLDIDFGSNYYSKMLEADRFYKQGDLVKVEQIQREVKQDFAPAPIPLAPQVDAEQLSPAGRVYWRHANEGIKQNLETKIFVPLEKLTETSPDFVPGHLLLVDAYEKYEKEEEALGAIERLAELYPEQTDVLDKRIEILAKNEKYLEASIAARQFTIAYPNNPESSRYQTIAAEYKQTYLKKLKEESIMSGILSTAINTVFIDGEAGLQTGALLLAGETEAGNHMAKTYKQNFTLVDNAQQLGYVDSIGQKLAKLMGRDDFKYEFFIVEDSTPNASALPGGKIFINTGILQLMDSESELAGILAHEIAHSVLSHGFQDIANNSISSILPLGEYINADFSRDQEKEADLLGTRVLASADYSADGIYNIMAKLKQLETKSSWSDSLLASHPASEERMNYLEEIIQQNGYNRYGYEGVQPFKDIFTS